MGLGAFGWQLISERMGGPIRPCIFELRRRGYGELARESWPSFCAGKERWQGGLGTAFGQLMENVGVHKKV